MRAVRFLRASTITFGVGLLFLTSAWGQASPQQPRPAITISGTVRDPGHAPVPGATVGLQETSALGYVEGKTDQDGKFSFSVLKPGTYIVRISAAGFEPIASQPMHLAVGDTKIIDLAVQIGHIGSSPFIEAPQPEKRAEPQSKGQPQGKGAASDFQVEDKPNFTVAGVTDWTNVGGHGSDVKLRTSESLAKETASLKPTEGGDTAKNAGPSESARVAEAHRVAGDRAEKSGDLLAAEHEYEQAVRLDPSEANYFAWGTELLLHRAVRPAAEVFTKGSSLHPKSARMLAGLGAALYASGYYAEAAQRVCAASDLQPADAAPYLFLGKMEKAAPDPLTCAAEKLARFAHDQPQNAQANYYFAVALWKRAQRNDSIAYLPRCESLLSAAIAADPEMDSAYVYLGMMRAAGIDFRGAIEQYKKAVAINPQSPEAHYRLSQAYKRIGEEQKAQQELELYKQADKAEADAVERQRREIRQFLIILKDQPQSPASQAPASKE